MLYVQIQFQLKNQKQYRALSSETKFSLTESFLLWVDGAVIIVLSFIDSSDFSEFSTALRV